MKKPLIGGWCFLLIIGGVLALRQKVNAQYTGTFSCQWRLGESCIPGDSKQPCCLPNRIMCKPGHEVHPWSCFRIKDPNECETAEFDCVRFESPPVGPVPITPPPTIAPVPHPIVLKRDPCYNYKNKTVDKECAACLGGRTEHEDLQRPNYGTKYWTALGCIPFDPAEFIKILIRISFGIGGGIAFLFMVIGAFKVLTSQGNPELLNEGKSMITSSIAGLLLIIFSVIILKIIGYDILQLPGFEQKQSFKRSNNFSFYFKQDYQYTQ